MEHCNLLMLQVNLWERVESFYAEVVAYSDLKSPHIYIMD